MDNFHLIDHPLIKHKMCFLRDKTTGHAQFRNLVEEISSLMAYEVSRNLPLTTKKIETPLEKTKCLVLAKPVLLVPVLRAGLGMISGMLRLIPDAVVGHIGLYRNEETLKPVDYYINMPQNIEDFDIIITDPMLATGGSGVAAVDFIKEKGAKSIRFVCIVAAPQGVKNLQKKHYDVPIYAAALDRELNDKGYILPGLGDAGDRIYGT